MSRIVLSEASRIDRREITAYTVEHFGLHQARRLREAFQTTLDLLAASPHLGRAIDEVASPGHALRCFVLMKRFLIVYEPTREGIRVARLLHGSRDVVKELERGAGGEDAGGEA